MDTNVHSLKYKQAVETVAELFRQEVRLITGTPYVVHLVGVSHVTRTASDDEDVWIAALLHDVLEDIDPSVYDEARMRAEFGDKITDIVKTVSHDDAKYDKQKARELYLEQLETGTIEACIVSAADLLHNAQDIVYLYGVMPDKVASEFGGGRANRRRWFWGERYKILCQRLGEDHVIVSELGPLLDRLEEIHTEIL